MDWVTRGMRAPHTEHVSQFFGLSISAFGRRRIGVGFRVGNPKQFGQAGLRSTHLEGYFIG
jgi:hypothetical protein